MYGKRRNNGMKKKSMYLMKEEISISCSNEMKVMY